MPPASRTLVVFVEPAGRHFDHLRQLLLFEGLDVTACAMADLHRIAEWTPQLVVLNHARLGGSAMSIAQSLGAGPQRPLTLVLVAHGDEQRGIELVERSADGFLAVPCGSREFMAHVRAMLRRVERLPFESTAEPTAAASVTMPDLDIDPARRRVRAAGRELRLTEQEFQLLYFLAGHPGRVFDRQALLDAIWGREIFVTSRSVDALVKRLRHQLRPVLGWPVVETVRGVGYRLGEPSKASGVSAA